MSETRTVSPTLEERLRLARAVLETFVHQQHPTKTLPEREALQLKGFIDELIAAAKEHGLVIGEGELDVAWKEAEAALPDGWSFLIGDQRSKGKDGWWATASEPYDEVRRGFKIVSSSEDRMLQPTPAAALQALAAKLRDSRR